jgi:transcriptional regulator with XRE-family HTH domain
MGRMKASPGSGEVNPLQRMLGTFLRLERARLGYSTKEVADRLGLNDTYYRLAESGRAALNQSLVFKLIEVFATSSAPTHDSRAISFNRFALFLVGAHWVGAEMALQPSKMHQAKHSMEALASLDSDFQIFHEKTKPYFELHEVDDQKRFLEDVAAPEVGDFLRLEAYGQPTNAVEDLMGLNDLPTLNIDILLDLKKSLTSRLFIHTHELAAGWESERGTQFKSCRGIFIGSHLIINENNLGMFHYDYLSSERYKDCRYIFIDSIDNKSKMEKNFIDWINNGRSKLPYLSPVSEKEINKIKFVWIDESEREKYSVISNILSQDSNDYQAYWSFELHSGLQVSFVGVQGGNVEIIRNLNLRDSYRKSGDFDKLWLEING